MPGYGSASHSAYQDILAPCAERALERLRKSASTTSWVWNSRGGKPARGGRISKSGSTISRARSAWRWSRTLNGSGARSNVFGFVMPGEVRLFAVSEALATRDWIVTARACPLPLSLPWFGRTSPFASVRLNRGHAARHSRYVHALGRKSGIASAAERQRGSSCRQLYCVVRGIVHEIDIVLDAPVASRHVVIPSAGGHVGE